MKNSDPFDTGGVGGPRRDDNSEAVSAKISILQWVSGGRNVNCRFMKNRPFPGLVEKVVFKFLAQKNRLDE